MAAGPLAARVARAAGARAAYAAADGTGARWPAEAACDDWNHFFNFLICFQGRVVLWSTPEDPSLGMGRLVVCPCRSVFRGG
jgi:hypothetical protein